MLTAISDSNAQTPPDISAQIASHLVTIEKCEALAAKTSDQNLRNQYTERVEIANQAIALLKEQQLAQQKLSPGTSLVKTLIRPRSSSLSIAALTVQSGSESPLLHTLKHKLSGLDLHQMPSDESAFDVKKYTSRISIIKANYRFHQITRKLKHEQFICKSFGSGAGDAALNPEFVLSQSKIRLLEKAKIRYDLGIHDKQDHSDETGNSNPTSGRLKLKLIRIASADGIEMDTFATISIDRVVKHTTQSSSSMIWNETLDILLLNGSEVEICVFSYPRRDLVGFVWFSLADLASHSKRQFPNGLPTNLNDMEDSWLDLEPAVSAGQIFIRASFGKDRPTTALRRQAIRKAFVKNGHKFHAVRFPGKHHCPVCNETSDGSSDVVFHQCQECNYSCHAKCHANVLTKCITLEEIQNAQPGQDTNTGQLCQLHRIPHRFKPHTFIGGSSWCTHCGDRMGPGTRLVRCLECEKCAHIHCQLMVPNFCGLRENVVLQWLKLLEELDRKQLDAAMMEARTEERERRVKDLAVRDTLKKSIVKRKPVDDWTDENLEVPQIVVDEDGGADQKMHSVVIPQSNIVPQFEETNASLPLEKKARSLNDFHCVTVLGRGAFGLVMLSQDKTTKRFYALKALNKKHPLFDPASILLEKRIFVKITESQHPFLVNLHSCFETNQHLCFAMEYTCGGDLLTVHQTVGGGRFSIARARFYAAELLLAVEFLHRNGIVHRDLKLENILVCYDGHTKLADYGICRENMPYGALTNESMGTPSYMAYELLRHERYGRAVDWWSFGVCFYVMISGAFPFRGDDAKQVLKSVDYPERDIFQELSGTTLKLLQGLLKKDPKNRLGGGPLDAEEIMDHPFFVDVDWELLLAKKVNPPWRPQLQSEVDVSNFGVEFTSEALDEEFTQAGIQSGTLLERVIDDFDYVAQ